jgi:phosphonate transport system substrate-binding protein
MVRIGAVAYDPKVVTIWEGFCAWLAGRGLPATYVLYQDYEQQVDALLRGEHDASWNSPLAWLEAQRKARRLGREAYGLCMRDTDQDLTSVVLVREDSPIRALEQLAGRRVAVGAYDSPQATLIPLGMLQAAGVAVDVIRFDVAAGKHGDHVGGERDAAQALVSGQADAACVLDANHLLFTREGTLPSGFVRVLARTPSFDHCLFTAIAGARDAEVDRLRELLLSMRWEDPHVRHLLELEGLREWRPARTSGLAALQAAVDQLPFEGARRVRDFIAAPITP